MIGFDIVEKLIAKKQEYKNVDYKKTWDWDNKEHKFKIVKNILAFSNTKDGGYIVIGFDEKTKEIGMDELHYEKISKDYIYDFAKNYADNDLNFEVDKFDEQKVILITIKECQETLVMCVKNEQKVNERNQLTKEYHLEKNAYYIRTNKPETKVATTKELRDMIETSKASVLVDTEEHQQALFSKERKKTEFDAREKVVLEALKEKTYYTITMTPTEYEKMDEITLPYLKYSLKESAVDSRGWQYPFVGLDDNFSTDPNGYVKTLFSSKLKETFDSNHEITTAYKSGQVVFSFSSDEDWKDGFEEDSTKIHLTIFKIADSIEFLSRYINKLPEVYQKGIHLELKFYNPKEYRKLYFGEFGYHDDPTSTVNRKKVTTVTQNCTFDDLSKGYRKISAQISHGFFEAFNSHLHLNDVMRYQEELENERR